MYVNMNSNFLLVPTPTITMRPLGSIQGALVGSPQNIRCIVSTISGVGLSSVKISWTGPGGGSIANNDRVTISPTTSSGNDYTSSLQFTYLMEGDEGTYTCKVVIVNARNSISLQLSRLTSKPAIICLCLLIAIVDINNRYNSRANILHIKTYVSRSEYMYMVQLNLNLTLTCTKLV